MKKHKVFAMPSGKFPGLMGMQNKAGGYIEKKMGIKSKKSMYAK